MEDLAIPDTPSIIRDLFDHLKGEGFKVIENQSNGATGLRVVFGGTVRGADSAPQAFIEISADRDHWTIGVRFADMSRFIEPRVWAAYLEDRNIVERNLVDEVRFVVSRLPEAAQAVQDDPSVEEDLVRLGENHMRQRLGWQR